METMFARDQTWRASYLSSHIEFWNILSWKGPIMIMESNSWLHIEPPQKSGHTSESIVQTLLELWQALCCDHCPGELVQCSAVLWLCGAVSTEFYTEILSKCLVVNCAINLQPQSIIQRLYYE